MINEQETGMYMLEETSATSEIRATSEEILKDMEDYKKTLVSGDVREKKTEPARKGSNKHILLVCGEHEVPVSYFGGIFHRFSERPLVHESIADKNGTVYEIKDIIISEREDGSILYKYVLKMEES
jgi:hypothetical protein